MPRDLPGPGDPATWPPYTGHPNDPRDEGWLDDLDTVNADDTRCPVCGGCGWIGTRVDIGGRQHIHSPGESGRGHVMLRDQAGQTRRMPTHMGDTGEPRDLEQHGMEPCPVCETGEHPDAVCGAGRCDEREVVIDGAGTLTGLCAGHWIEIEREAAAVDLQDDI